MVNLIKETNMNRLILVIFFALIFPGCGNVYSSEPPWPTKLTLSGTIHEGIIYKISVTYSAQTESKLCSHWTLFGGTTRTSKFYEYNPIIKDGRHSIIIPLNEHNPKLGCKYKPHHITIYLNKASGKHQLPSGSFPLFYVEQHKKVNPPAYGFNFKKLKDNIINIECVFPDPNNIHFSSSPCGLYPVTDRFTVTQFLKPNLSDYEVNINFISQEAYNSGRQQNH